MRTLPKAAGPYKPGCMDVMLGSGKEGILMRLYYPTLDQDLNNPAWIPHRNYLLGIAKVLMVFPLLLQLIYWWLARAVPAKYGAKIHFTNDKIKPVIVSHGLGGHRNLYSNLTCELASRGLLVLALEHRDGSACYTHYRQGGGAPVGVPYAPIELGRRHFAKRRQQVEHRAGECGRALDFLIALDAGVVPENAADFAGSALELADLVGRIDLESASIAGHSFGGATALLTLGKRPELKQGILLDPWMFPIKDALLHETVTQPLLFINTQTFHIASNVQAMAHFLTNDTKQMYTILHTTHESQTDTVLIAGYWLNWFMKKLDAKTALRINYSLVLRFLDKWVEVPCDITDCEVILEHEGLNVRQGLTKPWA